MKTPSMKDCQEIIRQSGFHNSSFDWEDEHNIYAFSYETTPDTYGASTMTVHYYKDLQTLSNV